MRPRAARFAGLSGAALLLAACGDAAPPAPPSMSRSEAEALQDAAAMIDERRLPAEALATSAAPQTPPSPGAAEAP